MWNAEKPEPLNRGSLAGRLRIARRLLLPILLALELIIFTIASSQFLTLQNFANIATNAVDLALIAAGLTLVILLGGIDISTGFALGVIAWTVAFMLGEGLPPGAVLLGALLMGAAAGSVNGTLVAQLSVPSIVATLGTSAIFQMVLFGLWDRSDIFSGPVSPWLSQSGNLFGIPSLVVLVLFVYGVLFALLQYTKFGRSVYAVGSNREAASLSGVRTKFVQMMCFLIVGVLVGLAATTYIGRVGVVQASTGSGLTLLAIAAVLVGGTSILGGEGSVARTLGGVIFVALLQNGVVLAGVPPLWNGLMIGLVILVAVSFDAVIARLDSRVAMVAKGEK